MIQVTLEELGQVAANSREDLWAAAHSAGLENPLIRRSNCGSAFFILSAINAGKTVFISHFTVSRSRFEPR